MNWLAAIMQMPGINLQTNLWLIGTVQGLGKGTIVDIMRYILGSEFVGELNQTEIEAGWNDHLVGKQLIEVNEFDSSGKMSGKAWGKWLKGHTIEPSLKIRERQKTSYTVLHIGNFLGASNDVDQTFIDANDRRNQFIQTTPDTSWVQYATVLQLEYFKKVPLDVAAGFAHVLDKVKVDLEFISKAHKNQFRNTIAANSQSIIEEWLDNDPTITKGAWLNASDVYASYKDWFRTANPSADIPSLTMFGRVIRQSEHLGIHKQETRSNIQYKFDVPPQKVEHKIEDAVLRVNQITHDNLSVEVFDYDVVDDKFDVNTMTPVQKMRVALMKQAVAEGADSFKGFSEHNEDL
jgi:hypothetical protein